MIYKTLKKVSDVCQLLIPNFLGNQTKAGVTCTSNGNTFTLNGTLSEETYIGAPIYYITSEGAGHKFFISGCPQGAWSSYSIYFGALNQGPEARDYGNGAIFTSTTAAGSFVGISIEKAGITFDNLVFKPQLFDLTEMYGSGNEPATVEEFKSKFPNDLYDYSPRCFVTSYKNCLKVSDYCQLLDKSKLPNTQTVNGITYTVDKVNGTITANGTATAESDYKADIALNNAESYTNGGGTKIPSRLLFLGCPIGGSQTTYGLYNNWVSSGVVDTGNGGITDTTSDKYYGYYRFNLRITIKQGYTANNLVFKPMCINLTEIYGAGNEPTTVEQFKADFPDELYDYKPYSIVPSYKKSLACKTRNLFDIPLTRGYPSDTSYENTTLRTFTVGTYIIGMTRNNQYEPYYITNVSVSKNNILFKTEQSGYGVSVPFLLTVGNTYTVSCKADNNYYPSIGISYYKENGTFISYTQFEVVTNNPVLSFTVPENTYYTLILFYGRTGNEYTFSNIQLELGSTATEYHPYGYL